MVATQVPFHANKTLHAADKVAPSSPRLAFEKVVRQNGATPIFERGMSQPPEAGSLLNVGFEGPSSEQEGLIYLDVSLPGESTERVGYFFHIVDGTTPDGFGLPGGAWSPVSKNLVLHWDDERTWYQEPFGFRMCVTAIDSAGNESVPSDTVEVADDGQQGKRFEFSRRHAGGEDNKHYTNYLLRGTFEGTWTGKDELGNNVRLAFDGGRFKLTVGDSTAVGFASAFKRNAIYRHDCIDFEFAGQESPLGWRPGIFELHQNSLVACLQAEFWPRPTSFLPGPKSHRYDLIRRSHDH